MLLSSLDSVFLTALVFLTLPPFRHGRRSTGNSSTRADDYGVRCERVTCSYSSGVCPPWHYCNTHTRFCSPCSSCRDGTDVLQVPPANCQDPQFCIDSFDSRQDYACPWLRVDPDFRCSGVCAPCGGPFGYFLGTKCRVRCEDGDSEVFDCVFVNERAQWNIARRPRWIQYVNFMLTTKKTTVPEEYLTYNSTVAFSIGEKNPNPTQSMAVIVAVIVGVAISLAAIVFAFAWSIRRTTPRLPIKASAWTENPSGCASVRTAVGYSLTDLDLTGHSPWIHRWSRDDDGPSRSDGHEDCRFFVETRKMPVENEAESTTCDDSGYSQRRFAWGSSASELFFGVESDSTDN